MLHTYFNNLLFVSEITFSWFYYINLQTFQQFFKYANFMMASKIYFLTNIFRMEFLFFDKLTFQYLLWMSKHLVVTKTLNLKIPIDNNQIKVAYESFYLCWQSSILWKRKFMFHFRQVEDIFLSLPMYS